MTPSRFRPFRAFVAGGALQCAAAAFCVAATVIAPAHAADAADAATEQVQVTDPFIELRTGPGRGYPIHHVAGRDEWITITLRHTDWYKVRTASSSRRRSPRRAARRASATCWSTTT